MSSEIAIKVKNLSKSYQIYAQPHDRLKQFLLPRLQRMLGKKQGRYFREFAALSNVSFDIKKGETVGIIGRNGSGKSTLLQLVCGTLNPSSGSIQTHGRIAALLELGSGFNPEFSGRENVFLNAAVLGLSHEEIVSKYDEIVAFADIGDFLEQPVKTYSSGMTVRLAFAVAINVNPQILIVDEALSVGDELFQRKCFSKIDEIKKNGATILFVSHAGGTIVELCDHAILIDAGDMLAMGAPKIIVANYQKLLYAPQEKKPAIRQLIQSAGDGLVLPTSTLQASESNSKSAFKQPETLNEQVEFFDANYIPSTTLVYESQGAHISIPDILTLAGDKVNGLCSGKKYIYSYQVHFDKDSYDVRFGMMIKSINGTEIGGMGSATAGHGIESVAAGSTIHVKFIFQCHLLSGNYFVNAGCSGKINHIDGFLHRIVDAVAFRVLPEHDLDMRGGYINFAAETTCCQLEYVS